jgi:hypothetical protein
MPRCHASSRAATPPADTGPAAAAAPLLQPAAESPPAAVQVCADQPPLCSKRHRQRGSSCSSANNDAFCHHGSAKQVPVPQPDAVGTALPVLPQPAAAAVPKVWQVSQELAAAAVRRAHSRQLPGHLQQLKLHLVHCLLGPRSKSTPAEQPEAALAAGHAPAPPALRPVLPGAAMEVACLSRVHSGDMLDIAAGCQPCDAQEQEHVDLSASLQAGRLGPQLQQQLPGVTLPSRLELDCVLQVPVPVQAAVEPCLASSSPAGISMPCPGHAAGCATGPWTGSGQAGWPEGQAAALLSPGVALSTGLDTSGSSWGGADAHGHMKPHSAWPVAAVAASESLVDAACHMLDMAAHAVGTQLLQATTMLC